MLKRTSPVERFKQLPIPFYYYDVKLSQDTLDVAETESGKCGYHVYYAIKANANPHILSTIAVNGLGAGCIGSGKAQAALDAGFPTDKIVSANVGKASWKISLGLDNNIFYFNVESAVEPGIVNELAAIKHKVASIVLRANPEMDVHMHAKITMGMKKNKSDINLNQLGGVLNRLKEMKHVRLIGIHSHAGSQITDMSSSRDLAIRLNEIQEELEAYGVTVKNLNFGGGLSIDYYHPNYLPIPAFDNYSAAVHKLLQVRPGQQVYFEPGRSIVTRCGTLIPRVLYVKEGETEKFAILDTGFTELTRLAVHDAYHRVESINSDEIIEAYDVVGPVCGSSGVSSKNVELNKAHRGDLIALRSTGAYDKVMTPQYSCRHLSKAYYSNTIK